MICRCRGCVNEVFITRGQKKTFCSSYCRKRELNLGHRERLKALPVEQYGLTKLEADEFRSRRVTGQDVELPLKVRQGISVLSREGLGARPIGERLNVPAEMVTEWRKAHPMECENLPDVEVYHDLFRAWCSECGVETFMWVLSETPDKMHLYCPDCHHNQDLVHPRVLKMLG